MHRPSRRSVVALAAVASLGTGSALAGSAVAADGNQPRLLGIVLPAPLQGVLDTVVGMTPPQVSGLLATLDAGQIGDLLTGADSSELRALLTGLTPEQFTEAVGTLTPAEAQALLAALLGQTPGATTPPPAGGAPAGGKPATAPRPAAPAVKSAFGAYRAVVSSAVVNKTRRSMRLRVTCPANSPRGCFVRVSGQLAGRKAMAHKFLLLAPNSVQTTTVKLTSAATKRLKSKGGTVRLKTVTAMSSIPRASKNATKVKAPKKKKSSKK